MAYTLENSERIIHNLIEELLKNDILMKLLHYNTPDALDEDDLTDGQKMILANTVNTETARILYFPFNPETVEKARSELRIYIDEIDPENIHLADLNIAIQIVVHNELWNLEDGIQRPVKMISEILKTLNGVELEGIGKLYFQRPIRFYTFNKSYSGYIMTPDIRMG